MGAKEIQAIAIPSVGGATEKVGEVEPSLADLTKRAGYGWSDFLGHILKRFYPYIQSVVKEASMIRGSEEEIRIKATQIMTTKIQKPKVVLELFGGLPLPFIQLLQTSLAGYVSQFILEKTKELLEGFGLTPTQDSFQRVDEMLFTLYTSGIVFPVVSTTTCINTIQPHYDFVLSSYPAHKGNCRICKQPITTFNVYLVTEPYASLKMNQEDLSYVVAAYLINKGGGHIECFPEVTVKKDSKEEQVDVFVQNWMTKETAVIECKVKENPKTTFDTKVNLIRQDLNQLSKKMKALKSSFGYVISNIIFDSVEEKQKVLQEATKRLHLTFKDNIKLMGKIGTDVISEWDLILSDMKQNS